MVRRGFTAVELLITITIMGILLTVAVVSLISSQTQARDEERKTDVQTIANHLETFYRSGTEGSTTIGRYPSTVLTTSGDTFIQQTLQDINLKTLQAPGAASIAASFIAATNTNQTESGVTPQPTTTQYVYQPLQASGALCTTELQECRKFNIFYRSESAGSVQKVTSRNQ